MRIRLLFLPLLLTPQLLGLGVGTGSAVAGDDPQGVWPLAPRPAVVTGFDPPDTRWGRGHRGVDLAGSPGQVVRSALPGSVSFTGVIAGRSVVVVSHGDTRTTYEPVVATAPVGTAVEAGTPIGRLEARGSHCLPSACLHWGWIRNVDDVYLDPLDLVGSQRVRLLPFDGLAVPLLSGIPGRGSIDHRAPTSGGILGLLGQA
ncbi:peptidoglycan DD-metalloendopeptidase family protein [Nocardioides sp. Root151]|uniref:peptidoglycan DD-metalloendopeptidase family protein n=1 Tax=Nocardioides sp. Root151 TaxID=1736475 RepID=UPI0009E7C93E|nr:peptidoglycan DD-metalloendopeptidase family protein [Nocardioides sp. Root151]